MDRIGCAFSGLGSDTRFEVDDVLLFEVEDIRVFIIITYIFCWVMCHYTPPAEAFGWAV